MILLMIPLLTALAIRIQTLEQEKAKLIGTLEELQGELSVLQNQLEDLQVQHNDLKAQYDELQTAYDEALNEIDRLKGLIPPETPEFHPFSLLMKLQKSEMISGALQNKGTKTATRVMITLKILSGDIDRMELSDSELCITVSGKPTQTLFEFNAMIFGSLDPKETNAWKLTWSDASEETKKRFSFASVDQFKINGRVKVVIDLTCDEGVEEHWEFTIDL